MATQQEENTKIWTHKQKTLLINARLELEEEFRDKTKKRNMIWDKVLQNIKSIDETFPFSRHDITRKFLNFMVTYKRIKQRCRKSEAATSWEFFKSLDEVYRYRNDITVPECNLETTLDSVYEYSTDESNELYTPAGGSFKYGRSSPARKRRQLDVMVYLSKENDADRRLQQDFINCEREKLRIAREKVKEIKKIKVESLSEAVPELLSDDSNDPCTPAECPSNGERLTPSRKRRRFDIIEYLRKESEADRKLLQNLLVCEKEKLRVEKEKLKEIKKLREALLKYRK